MVQVSCTTAPRRKRVQTACSATHWTKHCVTSSSAFMAHACSALSRMTSLALTCCVCSLSDGIRISTCAFSMAQQQTVLVALTSKCSDKLVAVCCRAAAGQGVKNSHLSSGYHCSKLECNSDEFMCSGLNTVLCQVLVMLP